MIHLPPSRKIVEPRFGAVQKFGLSGRLRTVMTDVVTGEIRRSLNRNIITRAFLATVPLSFYEARAFYITQIRVGSGITTPTDTDSSLATQVASKAITDPINETFLTGATPYSIATVQFNLTEAIGKLAEAGQFDSDNAMANRALFDRGTVEDATQTDPVEIESSNHGRTSGDLVRFDGATGMTELNFTGANWYYIDVTDAHHFDLYTDSGLTAGLDGTGFGAFTPASPATAKWTLIIDKTSTKILQVSFEMQAQNAS